MGQLDQAAADFKKALELSPDVWTGHFYLSEIHIIQGRPRDALPEIELVRYEPLRVYQYAIAYHALGRKKESDAALSELITKFHAGGAYQIAEIMLSATSPTKRSSGWTELTPSVMAV